MDWSTWVIVVGGVVAPSSHLAVTTPTRLVTVPPTGHRTPLNSPADAGCMAPRITGAETMAVQATIAAERRHRRPASPVSQADRCLSRSIWITCWPITCTLHLDNR